MTQKFGALFLTSQILLRVKVVLNQIKKACRQIKNSVFSDAETDASLSVRDASVLNKSLSDL